MKASGTIAFIELVYRRLSRLARPSVRGLQTDDAIETLRAVCAAAFERRGWPGLMQAAVREGLDLTCWIVRSRFGGGPRVTQTMPRSARQIDPTSPHQGRLHMLVDDSLHAVRRLRAQPGTAALAAGMLALAIGVTSAMFTVADHMLLRPAPFHDPEHLARVSIGTDVKHSRAYIARTIVQAWRGSPAFANIHAFAQEPTILQGAEGLVNSGAVWITPGAFEMLGVTPLMGRTFVAGEGRNGTEDRVILSERIWHSVFGGDRAILGRVVSLSGAPATVIGIMPAAFHFPYESVAVWRPIDLDAPSATAAPRSEIVEVFARPSGAMPENDAIRLATRAAADVVPLKSASERVILRPIAAGSLDEYSRTSIVVLSAGVGLVFLVLCANVTNLILARTTSRRQEFGVCSALGASRGRLLTQAFLENLLLGCGASVAGLGVAWLLIAAAREFLPHAFLIRTLNPLGVDLRAMLATSALGVAATLMAGFPPAWIGTRVNTSDSLKLAARGGTESSASQRWTRGLLVAEVALAVALLVGAGVLVRSFVKLVRADRGLESHGVMTGWISLPGMYFKDRPSRSTFATALHDDLESLPGVTRAALSFGTPPRNGNFSSGTLESSRGTASPSDQMVFSYAVGPGFFAVYGIALLEGRDFQPGDATDQVIVGESLAKLLWPGASPIGEAFKFRNAKSWSRVIGVTREVRSPLMDPREDVPEYYEPMTLGSGQIMVGLRCGDACPSEAAIRERIRAINPFAMISKLQSLDQAYSEQFAPPRAAAALALAFAVVAVTAAAGGLFSVLSYAVGRRRREFGIRAAMGAQPAQIWRLVFKDSVQVAATGLALGAIAAWLLSRALVSLAFGVTIFDPVTWLTVFGVISGATLLAAWRPAVQAMRADPLSLLRDE